MTKKFKDLKIGQKFKMPNDPENTTLEKVSKTHYVAHGGSGSGTKNKANNNQEVMLESSGKLAGWIAFYNRKRLEIRLGTDAKDMYSAQQFAMKHFKIPKSKRGLLAISPGYDDDINESYKMHYPSLKRLTQVNYTDPRVNTEGRKIYVEKEGNFRKGDTDTHGHYIVYEDSTMPGTYIGVHIGSELSEDGGDAPVNVVAMDTNRSAVVNRVAYRMRKSKIAETELPIVETETEKMMRLAGVEITESTSSPRSKLSSGEGKEVRKYIIGRNKQKLSGHSVKVGQLVKHNGSDYYIYDHDADASAPGGSTLVIVKSDFSELVHGLNDSDLKIKNSFISNPTSGYDKMKKRNLNRLSDEKYK